MSTWAHDPEGTPPQETSAAELIREVAAALRMARWSGVEAAPRHAYTPPTVPAQQGSAQQGSAHHAPGPQVPVIPGVVRPTPPLAPAPQPSPAPPATQTPEVPHLPRLPDFMRQPTAQPGAQPAVAQPPTPVQVDAQAQLAAIQARAEQCAKCPRAQTRQTVVFGQGNPSARLLILLDAPNQGDEAAGRPGTGPEGALLDRMIAGMGLTRGDVWLTYLCLCRDGQRSPTAEEAATCSAWLRQQWQAVQPEAMLAMGGSAARFLTRQDRGLDELRGQWVTVRDTPAMLTWSPADLLADESRKRAAWADLQQVMVKLGLRR